MFICRIRFTVRCPPPPQQLSSVRAENSMPGISSSRPRSRWPAHRDQGWATIPIASTTRRGATFREVRSATAAGLLVWCLTTPFTLASFLPAQAGARQLPGADRAETLTGPTTCSSPPRPMRHG
eukprot:2636284-Prymnesium_polylepis.1